MTSRARGRSWESTCKSKAKAKTRTAELAEKGIDAAEAFLVRQGCEILEREWECDAGTCYLIAKERKDGRDFLVFVEVKTRRNVDGKFPPENVTKQKRERFESIACTYAAESDATDVLVRFDVITVNAIGKDKAMMKHHKNVFGC